MSIILDYQLREQLHHISPEFLITYFHDENIDLPAREGPVHWHPEFEIVTAQMGVLDYQVGEEHILLHAGDSIFVNANMLHGIKQDQPNGSVPSGAKQSIGILSEAENSSTRAAQCRFFYSIFFPGRGFYTECNTLI